MPLRCRLRCTGKCTALPFAPRATGNVATEDVVYMLERSGVSTGQDLGRIIDNVQWLASLMNTDLPGMVSRAGIFPPAAPR